MSDDSDETKGCYRCTSIRVEMVDVRIEFQSAIPLLVFDYVCLDCWNRWTDAHEPAIQSDVADE